MVGSETAALQVGDVDFLRRQVQRPDEAFEIRLPKYDSERTVHVPDALLQMLSEHVALGMLYDWLFAETDDVPPHQNTVGLRWRTTLRRAGVMGVRLQRSPARPAALRRLRADRLGLRRGRRPARLGPREVDYDTHHLRPPVAHRRGPRQGRRSPPVRRSRWFW